MKEQFKDSSHSLLRALHHCSIARDYFDDCAKGYSQGVKYMMNVIVANLTQSINKVRNQLSPELLKVVDNDLSDSLALESINEKLILLSTQQRSSIENILELMVKGEEIQIVDESLKY